MKKSGLQLVQSALNERSMPFAQLMRAPP